MVVAIISVKTFFSPAIVYLDTQPEWCPHQQKRSILPLFWVSALTSPASQECFPLAQPQAVNLWRRKAWWGLRKEWGGQGAYLLKHWLLPPISTDTSAHTESSLQCGPTLNITEHMWSVPPGPRNVALSKLREHPGFNQPLTLMYAVGLREWYIKYRHVF